MGMCCPLCNTGTFICCREKSLLSKLRSIMLHFRINNSVNTHLKFNGKISYVIVLTNPVIWSCL